MTEIVDTAGKKSSLATHSFMSLTFLSRLSIRLPREAYSKTNHQSWLLLCMGVDTMVHSSFADRLLCCTCFWMDDDVLMLI